MTGYKSKKLLAQTRKGGSMVDDLVKRLRNHAEAYDIDAWMSCEEAADLIEKQQQYIAVYQDQTNILLTRIKELEEEKDD